MLNPISTITEESALIPATSEPESASPGLFQSLIAELLAPTEVPDTPLSLPREAHPTEPRSGDIPPAPGLSNKPELPEIVSIPKMVLDPPTSVGFVASIPDVSLNPIHIPDERGIDTAEDFPQRLCTTGTSCALVERAYSDVPQAVGAVYDRPTPLMDSTQFALTEAEVTSIKIETEALPAPLQRSIEHVATPVQSETVPSQPAPRRLAFATPPQNDLPSPQVDVTKPEVQRPQTHPTLVQPLVQPEVATARQLVQTQPIAITAEAPTDVPAVIGASPHFTQNESQEKQDFRNENGRAPNLEIPSTTPHVETAMRFQSHLMPMESAAPVAHIVELPPQLPLPVAHRVSIDIGEKDSRVVVTLHENRGDVSVKIHAANEVLGAELRSSVGTLVEAFHREHIQLANMDFTTGYTTTSDGGRQHGNQPRQAFQNRARKFELAVAPTDQVEITSINLNA